MNTLQLRCVCIFTIMGATLASSRAVRAASPIDWKQMFHLAVERMDELDEAGCAALPAGDTANRAVFSADYARIAALFDFAARNLPDKLADRSTRLRQLAGYGVHAFESAYDCSPGIEHRHLLEAGDHLLGFVLNDLKSRAIEDEAYQADLLVSVNRIRAKMPSQTQCTPCSQKKAVACNSNPGPTPSPQGCKASVTPQDWGHPASLVLLLLGTGLLHRRRNARRAPNSSL